MNKRTSIILVLVVFGIIFSSISLINHYNFRTYAHDLGLTNNAIYDYAHFRWNDCMLMQPQFTNILSDHFSLYPIIVSPLSWILGSYTILIFQIIAVLLGGIGVFKYFKFKLPDNEWLPLLAMIHFFSIWGIYSALAFDYHDNVVAAMIVPWLFLAFEKGNIKSTIVLLLMILIAKENMALWSSFICLGLLMLNYKNSYKRNLALFMALISCVYFIVAVKFVIPSLANANRVYRHFNYAALGSNFTEAFTTIFTTPVYTFRLLFNSHLANIDTTGIKAELHYMILLSCGFVLLLRPQYLVMLIPIYAQKLFNDDFCIWGLNSQYSIEFVPILSIALFNWIGNLKTDRKIAFGILFCVMTFVATISSLDHRVSLWYTSENYRFYSPAHYKTDYDVAKINEALKLIPDNASVTASGPIVPHISFRDYIYLYPDGSDSDFIVLLMTDNTYPLTKDELAKKVDELKNSDKNELIYNENLLMIFKKK